MSQKRVCVIGAGAAGLAAIRHLNDSKMTGVVFEQTGDIGGIWNYTDLIGTDKTGEPIHSPAYKGLRTNLPKEIMGFLDCEMFGKTSFVYHEEVLEYLRNFAKQFNLLNNIQFNTRVTNIKPINGDSMNPEGSELSVCPQWEVTVARINGINETFLFDAVMICNGHFSKPQMAKIKNISKFKGDVIHSRDYRIPDNFTNKRVIVLGCGPSGIDIALEIVQVASELTISLKNLPYPGKLPSKIHQIGAIHSATENHMVFENGKEILCDILLLCTGYEYDLPFLSPRCSLKIEKGKQINHLYKHMINTKYPTMVLIGIPFRVCPFLLFDAQVRYFVSYLQEKVELPSEKEMKLEIEEETQYRERVGIPFSRSHQLDQLQWDYFQSLGKQAGFSHLLKPFTQIIYDQVTKRRSNDPENYKNDQICVSGDTLNSLNTVQILSSNANKYTT